MINDIQNLKNEIQNTSIKTQEELEAFRLTYLAKKGKITQLFEQFKTLSPEEKKNTGKLLNELKQQAETIFKTAQEAIENNKETLTNTIDFTLPSYNSTFGHRHPISIIRKEICEIFEHLGFKIEQGPEIEDDWHVFSALNFPPEHPARDMQDTFFIEKTPDILLRTHTSSVQIRAMEKTQPPLKIIMPGRVFRNEAISARAHCIFHQIEGLYIDTNVSFADLKQVLLYFAREFFGKKTEIRLRPSFFPFTEPSAEMDVSCSICQGKGCNVCKYTGWLEILGCGMVHPNVLRNTNIDPNIYSGYAFGMGIERITMLRYAIKDLRLFFENDVRFLEQF
ncbi:MAG: phenylalanine--tRNA ligase subunit alpha [Bacteroidales bacterium]